MIFNLLRFAYFLEQALCYYESVFSKKKKSEALLLNLNFEFFFFSKIRRLVRKKIQYLIMPLCE